MAKSKQFNSLEGENTSPLGSLEVPQLQPLKQLEEARKEKEVAAAVALLACLTLFLDRISLKS